MPHAGWTFSGRAAYDAVRRLRGDGGPVVLLGGHLRPGTDMVMYREEELETPMGPLEVDRDLAERIDLRFPVREQVGPDNTVEVQLPILKALFPERRIVCLRVPPDQTALDLALFLAEDPSGPRIVASTDLTHYGPAYGFTGQGSGPEAVAWVRDENDAGLIRLVGRLEARALMEYALARDAACSPGGLACAAEFARIMGFTTVRVLSHTTSYEIHPGESFVGYLSAGFCQESSRPEPDRSAT